MKKNSDAKKASFKGLLFREFFIIRKEMVLNLASYALIAALSLLILLSFRIGNLALLPENVKAELENGVPMDLMIVVISGSVVMGCAGAVMRDEFPAWQRFRRTTPVSPWRFALARYIVLAGSCVLCLVCDLLYELVYCAIRGERLNVESIAADMMLFAFLTAFCVVFQLAVMWQHSKDRAGIILCVLVMGFTMIVMFSTMTVASDEEGLDRLHAYITEPAMRLLPFMPFILPGILLTGYVCTGFLLKRREK